MKVYGRVLVALVLAATVVLTIVTGEAPVGASVAEFSPPSDDYVLAFEDEFDTIDADDWSFRGGNNLGGYNEQNNVEASGGSLHIAFLEETPTTMPPSSTPAVG